MSGTLVVKPQYARLTHDTETFDCMAPYCVIKIGSQSQSTNVCGNGGKNPTWSKDSLSFHIAKEDLLNVEVWDKDLISKNDLIGQGSLPMSSIESSGPILSDNCYLTYKGCQAGFVNLVFEWYPGGGGNNHPPLVVQQSPPVNLVQGHQPPQEYPPANDVQGHEPPPHPPLGGQQSPPVNLVQGHPPPKEYPPAKNVQGHKPPPPVYQPGPALEHQQGPLTGYQQGPIQPAGLTGFIPYGGPGGHEAHGTLIVKPEQARLTHDTESIFARMDPYCVIKIGNQSQNTSVCQNGGKNPNWPNASLSFRVTIEDLVNVEVWDKDLISKNDLVGQGSLAMSTIVSKGPSFTENCEIFYKGNKAGHVYLVFEWFPDSAKAGAYPQQYQLTQSQQYPPGYQPAPGYQQPGPGGFGGPGVPGGAGFG